MAVDDEPDVLDLVVMVLKSGGHEVVSAGSGTEALAKYMRDKPDLVLLDVNMPDMDGHQVLKKMKEMKPDQKAAFLTVLGVSDAERQAAIKNEGIIDYLRKPFTPDGLLEKVKECLEK